MPEAESLSVCFVCKTPIAPSEELVDIVAIDRYTLQRQLVEVEGRTETCHAACVPLAGPGWRPPRQRGPQTPPAPN